MLLIKYYQLLNQEYDVGGTCGIREGRREIHTGVWWGNLRQIDYLEDVGVGGMVILKWTL
jgi:hypothetical protein